MATVEKFEDLIAWQRARELTKEIYKAFKPINDHGFKDQIQRAAVSVISNISEGFESGTREEFVNYLYIAKASAGEVRAQLYVANDIGYLNIETFKYLNNLVQECSRLIQSFAYKVKGGSRQGRLQAMDSRSRKKISPSGGPAISSAHASREFLN